MPRLAVTAFLLSLSGAFALGAACAVQALPPPPEQRDRVPEPAPDLARQLFPFDATYRHGTPEDFAELEQKADALAGRYPQRADQARIWYEVAHVAAQSNVLRQSARVRKYGMKCLEVSRDPLQRARIYSYLACTADLSGPAFPAGRREATGFLLAGYVELLALDLPEKAPELPVVEKLGDLIGGGGEDEARARARHDAQTAARAEALYTRDLVERRDTLVLQLRDLYVPNAKRHGHNPEGPAELRALAAGKLPPRQVDRLMGQIES